MVLPGDDLLPVAQFKPTRAISIAVHLTACEVIERIS